MISRRFHHNLFVDVYWAELYTMFTGAGGVENKKIQFLSIVKCLKGNNRLFTADVTCLRMQKGRKTLGTRVSIQFVRELKSRVILPVRGVTTNSRESDDTLFSH